MCGITGIFTPDQSEAVDPKILQRMTHQLRHRGPDDEGLFVDGAVGFGARRLAIVDPTHGRQPWQQGQLVVVFNGEIYNHEQLRKQWSDQGDAFRSRCDTEVVAQAYARHGSDCLQHLRGMFALAVWDRARRELFLARDRLGIKPLYYSWTGRHFLFASEIKALLQHPSVATDLDPLALDDFMTFTYIPAPRSIFRSIRKLLPGHALRVSAAGVHEFEYWDLHFDEQPQGEQQAWSDGLRAHLREAVRLHLPPEGPVGVFLSGGVDSSAVTALAAETAPERIETLSMGFASPEFDERHYARKVAARHTSRARDFVLGAEAVETVDELTWYYDEPFADSSMIPTHHICGLARASAKVFLSGDGGDEVFAGYPRFAQFAQHAAQDPDAAEREYFRQRSWITPERKLVLYGTGLLRAARDYDPYSVMGTHFARARQRGYDLVSRVQYMETKTYLPGDLLTKLDRASMAHGLEVRVPLLDHRLVEYAARIPSAWKLRNGTGKYILKHSLRDLLPEHLWQRPKMGFSMPLADWLRGGARSLFEERVLRAPQFLPEVFDLKLLRDWWEQHQGGQDLNRFLWALLVLECWGSRFLRGAQSGPST